MNRRARCAEGALVRDSGALRTAVSRGGAVGSAHVTGLRPLIAARGGSRAPRSVRPVTLPGRVGRPGAWIVALGDCPAAVGSGHRGSVAVESRIRIVPG